jgi:protein required for attachment to host cells
MYRPKRKTWFMIADGAKARLFESLGPRERWELIHAWDDAAARMPTRELGDAPPVRGRNIGSGGRYAVEVKSEHDKAEASFIHECTKFLNSALLDKSFDQLVLAAPPGALGEFRNCLSSDIISNFIGVFDKDLTNMPDQELFDYFKKHLVRW